MGYIVWLIPCYDSLFLTILLKVFIGMVIYVISAIALKIDALRQIVSIFNRKSEEERFF